MQQLSQLLVTAVLSLPLQVSAEKLNGFLIKEPLVPANEIVQGGPPRDGIPSLDDPRFIAAESADYLDPDDRVLGLYRGESRRAYPVRILNYHEIVNDNFAGQAIAISFCPLCGTGMAFVGDIAGRQLEFGVSGLLYNSDVLMYDRQTGSLWSQISKIAINGPLKGTQLEQVALSHTTWRDWRSRYPDTKVLSDDTGYQRNYRVSPYPNYGRDKYLYFPVNRSSNAYKRKELVMGLEINRRFRAYPFKELKRGPTRFNDTFQSEQFDVLYDKENKAARILDTNGREIPTTLAFWFAWYAFHPETEIYRWQAD